MGYCSKCHKKKDLSGGFFDIKSKTFTCEDCMTSDDFSDIPEEDREKMAEVLAKFGD